MSFRSVPVAIVGVLSLLSLAHAHFLLNYPPTIGFSDDQESTAPCGGFNFAVTNASPSLSVGSFPLDLESTHPQAAWLFRAATGAQPPFSWTNVLPVVNQDGLGKFCLPSVSLPASFAGKEGIVQIVQNAVDGLLYQCAAVNFVAGSNSSVSSDCKNATSVSATITSLNTFPGLDDSTTSNATSTNASPSTTASATGSASGSATSTGAASHLVMNGASIGLLAVVGLAWL